MLIHSLNALLSEFATVANFTVVADSHFATVANFDVVAGSHFATVANLAIQSPVFRYFDPVSTLANAVGFLLTRFRGLC